MLPAKQVVTPIIPKRSFRRAFGNPQQVSCSVTEIGVR